MTKKTCCKICSNQECCPNPEKRCEPYDGCEDECEDDECYAFNDNVHKWKKLLETCEESTFISLAGIKKCICGYEIFQTIEKLEKGYKLQCMNCGDEWRIELDANNIINWVNLDVKEIIDKIEDSDEIIKTLDTLAFYKAVIKVRRIMRYQFWNRNRKQFFNAVSKLEKKTISIIEFKEELLEIPYFKNEYEQNYEQLTWGVHKW